MTTTVKQIVDRLGGAARLARELEISATAVYKWIERNEVPPGRAIQLSRRYKQLLELDDIPVRDAA